MERIVYFITHPNVVIDRNVPVPRWPLSPLGRSRMHAGLRQPWTSTLSALYCSTEQKALDGAQIFSAALSLPFVSLEPLGENDRSSTGFLPPAEFEAVADEFFAHPEISIRGWERAIDAQRRIVAAVETILAQDSTSGSIAIISHGAVGALLFCALSGRPISRQWDQPANGGGNYFQFPLSSRASCTHWKPIDQVN